MVKINSDKCTGCGICTADCLLKELSVVEGKCVANNKICYNCGHCVAVCPENAVMPLKEDEAEDIYELSEDDCRVDTDAFLNLLRYRRTIRKYKNTPVDKAVLEKVIEAGRISPTGMNSQEIRYVVIQNDMKRLTDMSMDGIYNLADQVFADSEASKAMIAYAHMWKRIYKEYHENGTDGMFYSPPAVVVVIANTKYNKMTPPVDAGIACANMEIAARTMGLGTCYIGFLKRAVLGNEALNEFLGVEKHEEIITAFSIGYPDVKYYRTVSRKKDKITWR